MDQLRPFLLATGFVASASELREAGFSRRTLSAAVAVGELERIRPGWYSVSDAPVATVRAIRAGGSSTCISAAATLGLWTPPVEAAHVSLRRGDRHLHDPDSGSVVTASHPSLVVHWNGNRSIASCRGILPLLDVLYEVVTCQPPDLAFAVIESALRQRRLDRTDRRRLWDRAPRRSRRMLTMAGQSADSGSESIFRFRFALLGIAMRSQVEVPGVGRADFVIGDRLLIEIDSQGNHGGRAARLRDLQRDTIAAGLGFICLRFDYLQIMYDWDTVVATVLAVIDRGDHLRARSR